jgi:hypothetical protein
VKTLGRGGYTEVSKILNSPKCDPVEFLMSRIKPYIRDGPVSSTYNTTVINHSNIGDESGWRT